LPREYKYINQVSPNFFFLQARKNFLLQSGRIFPHKGINWDEFEFPFDFTLKQETNNTKKTEKLTEIIMDIKI